MTIKLKISLALVFLFAILLLMGGSGMYYLNQLADDSQAILKDNYTSLQFVGRMQKALLTRHTDPNALKSFDQALRQQETNLTEEGEKELAEAIRVDFDRLKAGNRNDSLTLARIQQNLLQLGELNQQAMFRKNNVAEQTAKDALVWLVVTGTVCFLILFSFIINFPGYIANPLRELTRGIQEVASRNFEERLHFRSNDEFGELARAFNSMAHKLDEYEHTQLADVLFEKKRIDTLIQLMDNGILGLDEKKNIRFVNPVASRLLGVDEADLVGQYAPDVALTNDLLRTLIQNLTETRPEPEADRKLLKIYDEGKESYFNRQTHVVTLTRTGEEQPIAAGWVIVLENITAYQERDLAKTNFIATVSHELKTPISAIKMSLKLLDDQRIGALNDEQKELVNHVRNDADRLLNITGELLNMAQVESGQIQLTIKAVNPAELVQYATRALEVAASQRHVRFAASGLEGLPAIKADPDKATWVLVNLLSNAVRHSPEESTVEILARQLGNQVEFTVRDYGPGLRPEYRVRVFERYFRAPGPNGQSGGTGLGLAISKEFIQSMGGEIGLKDGIEPGAAFYFRLGVA
ncbi:signal transduction histidine kinase [Larkinella arboricola]|uniref:histidine kinase n=1 Tax=Larkinella arboricola TaxID=643671 RepID=A0A327WVR5_LARAB|nr:ATP-binding protein [Larkinella arboricola]RAJ95535.1 signal transduction histidine kinase [Larkinella arboricola]